MDDWGENKFFSIFCHFCLWEIWCRLQNGVGSFQIPQQMKKRWRATLWTLSWQWIWWRWSWNIAEGISIAFLGVFCGPSNFCWKIEIRWRLISKCFQKSVDVNFVECSSNWWFDGTLFGCRGKLQLIEVLLGILGPMNFVMQGQRSQWCSKTTFFCKGEVFDWNLHDVVIVGIAFEYRGNLTLIAKLDVFVFQISVKDPKFVGSRLLNWKRICNYEIIDFNFGWSITAIS